MPDLVSEQQVVDASRLTERFEVDISERGQPVIVEPLHALRSLRRERDPVNPTEAGEIGRVSLEDPAEATRAAVDGCKDRVSRPLRGGLVSP